jgi:hypothetical protein
MHFKYIIMHGIRIGHAWCCQKACKKCTSLMEADFWKNKILSSYKLLNQQTSTFEFQEIFRD